MRQKVWFVYLRRDDGVESKHGPKGWPDPSDNTRYLVTCRLGLPPTSIDDERDEMVQISL